MPFDSQPQLQAAPHVSRLDMLLGRGTTDRIMNEVRERQAAEDAQVAEWEAAESIAPAYALFAND